MGKMRELAIREQVALIKGQVVAMLRRNELMQKQNILIFFMVLEAQITNVTTKQYLELKQDEELAKL